MNMNMSDREKLLIGLTLGCALIYLAWAALIDPLLNSIVKTGSEIATTSVLVREAESRMKNPFYAGKTKFNPAVFNKETQLSYCVDFIYDAFKKNDIKLASVNLTTGGNKIVLDMNFKCSYTDMLRFLNSLRELNTYYVVDSFSVSLGKKMLDVKMKFTTVYI